MKRKYKEEYFFLEDLLEEVNAGLRGECKDIDCDKYIYKNLLKKKYKAVLEHNFSCLETIKREKRVLEALLQLPHYKKFRYTE